MYFIRRKAFNCSIAENEPPTTAAEYSIHVRENVSDEHRLHTAVSVNTTLNNNFMENINRYDEYKRKLRNIQGRLRTSQVNLAEARTHNNNLQVYMSKMQDEIRIARQNAVTLAQMKIDSKKTEVKLKVRIVCI